MHIQKLTLVLALSLSAGCAIPSVDVMPRYGTVDAEGSFGVRDKTTPGSLETADMGTAGFQKDDSVLGLRADMDLGMPRFMVSLQNSNHDGSGTLDANLTDSDGNNITVGTPVDSRLDLGLYKGVVTFDLFPTEMFELGLGFGLAAIDAEASITDTAPGGDTLDVDELVPLPVLALRGGVQLGNFEVSGLLDGMKLSASDDDVTYVDLDLFARYAFFGGEDRMRLSVALGYRHVDVDLEADDGDEEALLDATFSGPYFALQFSI